MSRKLINMLMLMVLPVFGTRAAMAAEATEMPRLERAVVFTPDFSASILSNSRMADFRATVVKAFPGVVESSGKFRVIDQELSRAAKTDEKVRNELISQYEVDAFLSLEVLDRSDTLDFVARMMGRKLEILLQESESVDLAALDAGGPAATVKLIETLVFRLFNRVPYDAKVLSMQGRFVVISGGSEQGVQPGDEFSVTRVGVSSRHPATGAWNKFAIEDLGRGQVMEVKERTSIARMISQIKPGAVRVGDVVKLSRIPSRARFAREATEPAYGTDVLGAKARPIPVEPITQPASPVPVTPAAATAQPSSAPAQAAPVAAKAPATEKPAAVSEDEGGVGGGRQDTWFGGVVSGIFSEGELGLGLRSWSVSGPVSASTAAPYTLVNNVSLRGTRRLSVEASGDFEADFSFGSTGKGSFTGYDLRANGYLEYPVARETVNGPLQIRRWRYGGIGRLVGLNVAGESFGGLDAFFVAGFIGGRGDWNVGEGTRKLGVQGDLFLYPLTVGSYGYKGSKQSIDSSLGTGIELKLFRPADVKGDPEYGLTWQYESHAFSLGNGKRAAYESSRFYLGIRSEL
ncbi:hypothetical protein EBZ80_05735 [bacterium]|nr:hypothetical protein [bacterium]